MQEAVLDRIRSLVDDVVQFAGMELVHMEMRREGGGLTLRIYIDKQGGVSLDDCARISRQVSLQLDAEDPIRPRYTLEVSSPGLDRPLHSDHDFQRFAGRKIRLSTIALLSGRRNFAGRLVGLVDGAIRMVLEDGEEVAIAKELVARAHLEPDYDGIGEHAAARGRHA